MASIKKNIILSNKQNKQGAMALLTLIKQGGETTGTLKTYNLPQKNVILAISSNGKEVLKQSFDTTKNISFVIHKSINLDAGLACVLVENQNQTIVPLVWGSEKENEVLKQQLQANSNAKPNINVQTKDSYKKEVDLSELFELSEQTDIDKIIDDSLQGDNIVISEEAQKIKQNLKDNQIFYDLVSEQIQDLFSKYESEHQLEQLIQNSKWVKVDYEQNGNEYVLGLIYDDINLKYICYGVPGEYSQNPPKDIESYSQWLPLDPTQPQVGGYWVMYQDAITGESIEIDSL